MILIFLATLQGGTSGKNKAKQNPPAHAGDVRDAGWIPGWGRSPGGGHSNPLQYSCLENPMDSGLQSMGVQSPT